MFDIPWIMLAGACIATTLGLAFLALAMEVHWEQVRGNASLTKSVKLLLQGLAALKLAMSLALCLSVDHASMAVLVWIMLLAAGTTLVAFTLTWRPHWLAPLVIWIPHSNARHVE